MPSCFSFELHVTADNPTKSNKVATPILSSYEVRSNQYGAVNLIKRDGIALARRTRAVPPCKLLLALAIIVQYAKFFNQPSSQNEMRRDGVWPWQQDLIRADMVGCQHIFLIEFFIPLYPA